jgi:sacsin
LLVGLVLPVVSFDVEKEWRQRLGWNELIPRDALLLQLEKGIKLNDRKIVNAVLKYIHEKGEFNSSHKALEFLPCVLNQNGCFVDPHKTFRTGCERLGPYLQNIDNSFWHEHSSLLTRLGIRDYPDIEDLLRIQKEFQGKAPLGETDTSVAIEIIKLAATFDRDQLSNLMIVTTTRSLCAIEEATYDDLGPLSLVQGAVNYAHSDIPHGTISKLCIEPLSERVKKGQLGLADVNDEDEFDQREEVATGIADTLDRYPVEATFKEYLANADDARATEVNWLLDRRQHPQLSLLTPELAKYQGPALLVHNDGSK